MRHSRFSINPDRRTCLSWILLSLSLPITIRFGQRAHATTTPTSLEALKIGLEAVVNDGEAAKDIGQNYLAAYPEEGKLDRLAADFVGSDTLYDFEGLRKKVADLRVRDFSNEDTAIIDGWIFARVEARICALLCLL